MPVSLYTATIKTSYVAKSWASLAVSSGRRTHSIAMVLIVSGILTSGLSIGKGVILGSLLHTASYDLASILGSVLLGVTYMTVMGTLLATFLTNSIPFHPLVPGSSTSGVHCSREVHKETAVLLALLVSLMYPGLGCVLV